MLEYISLGKILSFLATYEPLLQIAAAVLALALMLVVAHSAASNRGQIRKARQVSDKHQEELRAEVAKIQNTVSDAIGRRNASLEETVIQTLDSAMLQLKKQQAEAGEFIELHRASLREVSDVFAESNRQWHDMVGELRKTVTEQGVYVHDQTSALSAAQDRALSATAEQFRKSAEDRLAAIEQKAAEALDIKLNAALESIGGIEQSIHAVFETIERRVQESLDDKLTGAMKSFEGLDDKLASLNEVQAEIGRTGKEVSRLSRMLTVTTDGEDGGGDGEKRLADILARALDHGMYKLNVKVGGDENKKASALIHFPQPNGDMPADAAMDMSAFLRSIQNDVTPEQREEAAQEFRAEAEKRINYAASLTAPPQTSESALVFVPMEAAFADLHARHRDLIVRANDKQVWLVSPTTILAVLNTARVAARNYRAHQRLQTAREAVASVLAESADLERRLNEMANHANSAWLSAQRAEQAGQRMLNSARLASKNVDDESEGGAGNNAGN